MPIKSAGLIMYRFRDAQLEVFLVHPGGPFWIHKDDGVWSIPKGEYADAEEPLSAAKREFNEETGHGADGEFMPLKPVKQPGGKIIRAWAVEGDCDAGRIKSNTFTMEWPPRSGIQSEFPEVDRAGWFTIHMAKQKILKGQRRFLEELCQILKYDPMS